MEHSPNSDGDDKNSTPGLNEEARSDDGNGSECQQLKTCIGKVIGGLDAARRFQELIAQTLKLKKNH
jgi:hypothetical protein